MITKETLIIWGFKEIISTIYEADFSYDYFAMYIKEHILVCTIEYDKDGKYIKHYFDLNDRELTKRDLTIEDINLLKTIL